MRITTKLFGPQAQAAGERTATVDLPDSDPTCAALRRALADQYPPLRDALPACRFAVNHEFVDDRAAITVNDEIALIGQVSGG